MSDFTGKTSISKLIYDRALPYQNIDLKDLCERSDLAEQTECVLKHNKDLSAFDKRALVAYILDQYWEDNKNANPERALQEIKKVADYIDRQKEHDFRFPEHIRDIYAEDIKDCVKMLNFMYKDYIPFLSQNFLGGFLIGSMSYGRFFSVKNFSHECPSDLDLFLISKSGRVGIEDIRHPNLLEDIVDHCGRLKTYSNCFHAASLDLINYKLKHKEHKFTVSLTMSGLQGFQNVLDIKSAMHSKTFNLHWTSRMNGRVNTLYDMARHPVYGTYSEIESCDGNILNLPVIDSKEQEKGQVHFNEVATMLTPRFESIIHNEKIKFIVENFRASLKEIADIYKIAGMDTNICNLHPRKDRFSPLFINSMSNQFKAML
jgi:hypothetical protein